MSNKSTILKVVPNNLNSVADKYFQTKAAIKCLEDSLKELRTILEAEAFDAPNFKLELEEFSVALSDCSRDSFDLKSARIQLGEILNPFIKTTPYTRLNVKKN